MVKLLSLVEVSPSQLPSISTIKISSNKKLTPNCPISPTFTSKTGLASSSPPVRAKSSPWSVLATFLTHSTMVKSMSCYNHANPGVPSNPLLMLSHSLEVLPPTLRSMTLLFVLLSLGNPIIAPKIMMVSSMGASPCAPLLAVLIISPPSNYSIPMVWIT
ncbi:MAG: hypothetical protein ACD_40C00244G0001 [uncultured bacterium]|nr:MAG: hypothetical protein ACD_40C00244G0001 [uncultured bacterium]